MSDHQEVINVWSDLRVLYTLSCYLKHACEHIVWMDVSTSYPSLWKQVWKTFEALRLKSWMLLSCIIALNDDLLCVILGFHLIAVLRTLLQSFAVVSSRAVFYLKRVLIDLTHGPEIKSASSLPLQIFCWSLRTLKFLCTLLLHFWAIAIACVVIECRV